MIPAISTEVIKALEHANEVVRKKKTSYACTASTRSHQRLYPAMTWCRNYAACSAIAILPSWAPVSLYSAQWQRSTRRPSKTSCPHSSPYPSRLSSIAYNESRKKEKTLFYNLQSNTLATSYSIRLLCHFTFLWCTMVGPPPNATTNFGEQTSGRTMPRTLSSSANPSPSYIPMEPAGSSMAIRQIT